MRTGVPYLEARPSIDRILAVIARTGPVTASQIRQSTGIGAAAVNRSLRILFESGRIALDRTGDYGARAWRAA